MAESDYQPVVPRITDQELVPPAPAPVASKAAEDVAAAAVGSGLFTSLYENKMIVLGVVVVIVLIAIFAYVILYRDKSKSVLPRIVSSEPMAAAGVPAPVTPNTTPADVPATQEAVALVSTAPPTLSEKSKKSLASLFHRAKTASAPQPSEEPAPVVEEPAVVEQPAIEEEEASSDDVDSELDALMESPKPQRHDPSGSDDADLLSSVTSLTLPDSLHSSSQGHDSSSQSAPAEPAPGCCTEWLKVRYCRHRATAPGGKCWMHATPLS